MIAHSFAKLTCGGCAFFLLKDYGRAVCRLTGEKIFSDNVRCDNWTTDSPGVSAGHDLTVRREYKVPLLGKSMTRKSDIVFGGK